MKHQIWTRVVVTSLVLLGDGAFASENDDRTGIDAEANSSTIQVYQPAFLNDSTPKWLPLFTSDNVIPKIFNLTYQIVAADVELVSDALKYPPFNPRAPPVRLSSPT